ncbi:Zinc finger protein 76 [Armadillidium vulgare]|nr:Zinc finger protein 76 [Armadillidium vulgare]
MERDIPLKNVEKIHVLSPDIFINCEDRSDAVELNLSEERSINLYESDTLVENKSNEGKAGMNILGEGEYILILTGGNIRVSNEGESICLEQINPNEDKITIDDEMITVETSLVNSLQEPENKVLSATQFKALPTNREQRGSTLHICSYCKESFSTGYALKTHIRKHTGEKPYVCPNFACQKKCKTSGDLLRHIRTHTGEKPSLVTMKDVAKSFLCNQLPKSFKNTFRRETLCLFSRIVVNALLNTHRFTSIIHIILRKKVSNVLCAISTTNISQPSISRLNNELFLNRLWYDNFKLFNPETAKAILVKQFFKQMKL